MSSNAEQPTMWDEEKPYQRLIDKYGVWPTTVWDVTRDKATQELKSLIGDAGEEREGSFMKGGGIYGGKVKVSIFNPAIAAWALNLFAPEAPAVVLDPFAGGGSRAIVAAAKGYEYRGVELRKNEVAAVNKRLEDADLKALIVQGDARKLPFPDASADFLLTCPPYWNLEKYEGGEADLSMADTYRDYIDLLCETVYETKRVLKPGALSVWVTGLIRDKDSRLLPIPHDLAWYHAAHGFKMKEEVILNQQSGPAIQRVGNFERGNHLLVRVHEYLSVFER